MDILISSTLILITGVPHGCVLSPALFTLFTQDCTDFHSSNAMLKFVDDTIIVDLTSGNDETHCREEVQHLVEWCSHSSLALNTTRTKETIVDFRTPKVTPLPLQINGEEVEGIKFLVLHITKDLSWTLHTLTS